MESIRRQCAARPFHNIRLFTIYDVFENRLSSQSNAETSLGNQMKRQGELSEEIQTNDPERECMEFLVRRSCGRFIPRTARMNLWGKVKWEGRIALKIAFPLIGLHL